MQQADEILDINYMTIEEIELLVRVFDKLRDVGVILAIYDNGELFEKLNHDE